VEAILNRWKKYNDTLDYIDQLEEEGKAIVIRASKGIKVDRLEKDPQKLRKLFQNGYDDAESVYDRIIKFIG
jgi:predicted patatin/cPLA2 family phospholipase